MKSRLNFIKALLHDPLLLCLDEPTSGLIMSKGAATVTYTWLENGEHSASCPLELQPSKPEELFLASKELIAVFPKEKMG